MVKGKELNARIKDYFSFEKQELAILIPAIFITAFMFSFRDWGDKNFQFWTGFGNLLTVSMIAAISFFARFSWQKIYALKEGYLAQFKGWWSGILVALVLTLITNGRIPLVLIGGIVSSFIVRQRLGEFRYGHSYLDNAKISFSGVIANLILALIFAVGLYFFPDSFFLSKGLLLNWIMALCASLPLPQLDGLNIYFGSRTMYFTALVLVGIFGILLFTQTKIGLVLAVFITAVASIIGMLIDP